MIGRLYLWLGMAGAGVAVIGAALAFGYYQGRTAGRVEALQDSVEAYQKRERIDDEIGSMDDVRLCLQLGGLPDECNELGRLEENSGDASGGGQTIPRS
jgi:hypothetical protein